MFNINFCRWLDSNRGPLQSEATPLPTEPQPQPIIKVDHLPFRINTGSGGDLRSAWIGVFPEGGVQGLPDDWRDHSRAGEGLPVKLVRKHHRWSCENSSLAMCGQCDQIGRFLKALGNKFPCKGSSKYLTTIWPYWKVLLLSKICCGYFMGNFWDNLGYFYANIWSHCS